LTTVPAADDPRWKTYVERLREGQHYGSELLHDLFPPVVYPPSVNDIPRTFWAHSHQCSIVDDIGRQCIREAGHDYECIIPIAQVSATHVDTEVVRGPTERN
jgi:hypothetical protein